MAKKDKNTSQNENALNKYQKAVLAWDERVGQGKRQLSNWRFGAVISLLIALLLVIALTFTVINSTPKVYVAQVGPKENVQSVRLIGAPLTATKIQKIAFINNFVSNLMTIPLDPIVLRNNWLHSYAMASGEAQVQLTKLANSSDPFSKVGSLTQTIKFGRANSVSANSYDVMWTQTTFNQNGQKIATNRYSGIFTLQQVRPSNKLQEVLVNPFGLKVIYFSINRFGGV